MDKFNRSRILIVILSLLSLTVALLNESYVLIGVSIVALLSLKFSFISTIVGILRAKANRVLFKAFEWIVALVLSALVIQNVFALFFEIYTVPSVSMSPNLGRGDVVVVSKSVIGARLFEESASMCIRIGGFGSLKRGDIIAFNYPEGDSCFVDNGQDNYLYIRRLRGNEIAKSRRLKYQSVSDRARYLKRIVGLAGDTISLRRGDLHVNGSAVEVAPSVLRVYEFDSIKDYRILNQLSGCNIVYNNGKAFVDLPFPYNFSSLGIDTLLTPNVLHAALPDKLVFPFTTEIYHFNADNIGSIVVPKKGQVVDVNSYTLPFYKRIISVYEDNLLVERDGRIYINGTLTTKYEIQQDYYWVMGDNRGHSFDSRYWGFVPSNHIIGVASFVLERRDEKGLKRSFLNSLQ
ncbi:MAG: signal peptidase I [Breznakibacter sp.]|nr:signal peptidase I [Breznakibacter sp.]